MGKKEVVTYDDFSGGERGTYDDWRPDPPNSFRANNMLVYESGELGVRAGLYNESPSGVPTGTIRGYGTTPTPDSNRWFCVGSSVYTFSGTPNNNNLVNQTGSLSGTPTHPIQYVEVGNSIYLAVWDDHLYRLDQVAHTLTAIAASPGADKIARFGDRLLLSGVNGSPPNRVRYSDALDYTAWPAANFFDVGDETRVAGMWNQRGNLIIGKPTGIFALSGVPGYNASLRQIVSSFWNGPVHQSDGVSTFGEVLYFKGLGLRFPSWFNGILPEYKENLTGPILDAGGADTDFPPPIGVVPLRSRDRGAVFIGTSDRIWAFVNGAWTKHSFTKTVAPWASTQGVDNMVTLTSGGGSGSTAKFYVWDFTGSKPGVASTTRMPGDDTTSTSVSGTVAFPEWWAPNGAEIRVDKLILDIQKWDMGGSEHNQIDARIRVLRRREPSSVAGSYITILDEAQSVASPTGTLDRLILGTGQSGVGNGFQIELDNIKGCAIQRMQVIYEVIPFRGL